MEKDGEMEERSVMLEDVHSCLICLNLSKGYMEFASRYWQLVRIDATGKRRVEEMAIAKLFFHQQFAYLLNQWDGSDLLIQKELFNCFNAPSLPLSDREAAYDCLRCFISHCIEQVCVEIELKFGNRYGFTCADLFPIVLDDDGKRRSPDPSSRSYQLLADEILQTFDPQRAGLGTWTARMVRHHPELSQFLWKHGVYLASDWAILSDTSPEQLQRVLSEFYSLTPSEVKQGYDLLRGYHLIYRQDRLCQRQAGLVKGKERCLPPTPDQLTRIAQYVCSQTAFSLSNDVILSKLQSLAAKLRQYRVYIRGGGFPTLSLDQPDTRAVAMTQPMDDLAVVPDEQNEFLRFYREQFVTCLDQALARAIGDRITYLKRRNVQMAEQFLRALYLFHCQGQSMGEIAGQIGLQAQYQVTRLMKLKEFRATVRQGLLALLHDPILDRAKTYIVPERLHNCDRQIEVALDEQVTAMMQQAQTETLAARHHSLRSLFARRLCTYLDQQRFSQ